MAFYIYSLFPTFFSHLSVQGWPGTSSPSWIMHDFNLNCDLISHSAWTDRWRQNILCHLLTWYFAEKPLIALLSWRFLTDFPGNLKLVGLHLLKLKLQGSCVHSVGRVRLYLNPFAPGWTRAPTHRVFKIQFHRVSSLSISKLNQTPHEPFSRPLEECAKTKLLGKTSQACENLCKDLDYD